MYNYIKSSVLNDLDMNLYGPLPKSSTMLALLDMLHDSSRGTDGKSATRRTVLFDKAFDLIDHNTLTMKLCMIEVPNGIIN